MGAEKICPGAQNDAGGCAGPGPGAVGDHGDFPHYPASQRRRGDYPGPGRAAGRAARGEVVQVPGPAVHAGAVQSGDGGGPGGSNSHAARLDGLFGGTVSGYI